MGSPELPNDTGDNPPLKTPQIHYINQNISDESDIEDDNEYNGYEPLPMVDDIQQMEPLDGNNYEMGQGDAPVSDLPTVMSTDAEIEIEVWNQPRPRELEIELDSTRTEQIMSVMSSITLPTSVIPDWAQGISEERWKQELLERIRQRKELS